MPRHDIVCPEHGQIEIVRLASDTSAFICWCGAAAKWIPPVVFFQEDRLRLWRNAQGSRHSVALGEEMPQTARERDRAAARKGIEFVTPGEFLRDNKEAREAVEYKAHVDAGGKREPWAPVDTKAVFKPKPEGWKP